MSGHDITHHVGDDCPGGHHDEVNLGRLMTVPRPAFARGDVLLMQNLSALGGGRVPADGDAVLRVLGVEEFDDGWRLTVERLTGEKPTDG